MSAALIGVGAAIFVLLGLGHAVFTFQSTPAGGPMMPTNTDVLAAMEIPGGLGLAPQLQSTLFRAWIGFNLSHSLGVIVFATVMLRLAVGGIDVALDDPWFVALAVAGPALYLLLAINFWFDKPRNAIALASVLTWAGVAVELL